MSVYYKIFVGDKGLSVVCLQEFDESDYPKHRWFSERKFNTEEDAQEIIDCVHRYVGRYILTT